MENGNGSAFSDDREAAFSDEDVTVPFLGLHKVRVLDRKEVFEVCRDFLKNICNRGTRCKFKHPVELAPEKSPADVINFCNDYQNSKCLRDNCRFVHAARPDAEAYKRSGNITIGLAKAMAAILGPGQDTINGTPICKEWLTGNCSRGPNRCRYWHVNPEEEREARLAEMRGGARGRAPASSGQTTSWRGSNGSNANAAPAAARQPAGIGHGQRAGALPRTGPAQQPANVAQPGRDFFIGSDYAYQGRIASNNRYEEPALVPLGYGTTLGGVGAGPAKRGRFDNLDVPMRAVSPGYVEDLERKNAELIREMDSLKAELARQRERYEDLYILHTRGVGVTARATVVSEPLSVAAPAPVVAVSSVGFAPSGPAAAAFTSASEAHHLVASLAQQVAAAPGLPVQVPLQSLQASAAMPIRR